MLTPYDWQEGIGHRASFVESRLAKGAPVLALSHPEGIILVTGRRQTPKLSEIYDRIGMGAIGQQSDVEAIRVTAVEFAHREGFQRSEEDVTIQRLVAGLSVSVKRAFSDFGGSPLVARTLFVEVGETPEDDVFMILDFDGDYQTLRGAAALLGESDTTETVVTRLTETVMPPSLNEAAAELQRLWRTFVEDQELTEEAMVMDRSPLRENRFRRLAG